MSRNQLRFRSAATIVIAAFASFIFSVVLWFLGYHEEGIFVGIWVPSIISFGVIALQIVESRDE